VRKYNMVVRHAKVYSSPRIGRARTERARKRESWTKRKRELALGCPFFPSPPINVPF